MDAYELILAALAVGSNGTSDSTTRNSYVLLRDLLIRKFVSNSDDEIILTQHEQDPDTWKKPLLKALTKIHADQDADIIDAARRLISLDGTNDSRDAMAVNVSGDRSVGFGGSVSSSVIITGDTFNYLGSTSSIDWKRIDYAPHLKRSVRYFTEHMRYFAGASSEEEAFQRYLPLHLKHKQFQSTGNSSEDDTETKETSEKKVGTWSDLVTYPTETIIWGDPGSGKTTSLLYAAQQLAKEALENSDALIPIYIPLKTFRDGTADTLLEMVAYASGLELRVIEEMWRGKRRPLCLLLDGIDEVSDDHLQSLTTALDGLRKASNSEYHSIIITSRPGSFEKLIKSLDNFYELEMLLLNDSEIDKFLAGYNAVALQTLLDTRLRLLVQRPDLLAAYAQVSRNVSKTKVPQNAGQIYKLLIDDNLFCNDQGQYDYQRIKRPVLAFLAYAMLKKDKNTLLCDDSVRDQIAQQLETIDRRYRRRRRVMPDDWNVQGLLDELANSPVLELIPESDGVIRFKKLSYRDYFTAVHLVLSGVNSSEVQHIITDLDHGKWSESLLMLLGILPEAEKLFDVLYRFDPSLASQLWLGNGPSESEFSNTVKITFFKQMESLKASPLIHLDEMYTERLLIDLLNNADPFQRLQATCALSQWGLTATDALLDAAEDDHPLVRAVAQNALLHLGETAPNRDPDRPVSPLLLIDKGGLCFCSNGGCNARIGDLQLIHVPDPTDIHFRLNIARLDLDPFVAESTFTFVHTPPLLFSSRLFEKYNIDWLHLTARLRLIVEETATIVHRAEKRPKLADLVKELQIRTARYAHLGRFIAQDLRIPWEDIELSADPEWIAGDTEKAYKQLRNFYNRALSSSNILLDKTNENNNERKIEVQQTIKHINDSGSVTGIEASNFTLGLEDERTNDERSQLIFLELAQNINKIAGGISTGLQFGELRSSSSVITPYLRIDCTINIDKAYQAQIIGLLIQRLVGSGQGWKINLTININSFMESRLRGVIAEQHDSIDSENKPEKTSSITTS